MFAIAKSRFKRKLKNLNSNALTPYQMAQLNQHLVAAQLDVFEAVVLPLLKQSKALTTSKNKPQTINEEPDTFEELLNDITQALAQLKTNPQWFTQQATKNRDMATTLFVVFRIVYRHWQTGITDHSSSINDNNLDEHLLFKRLPTQLSLYLGAEYWRAFELFTVVAGDLSQLKLNQDITDRVSTACGDVPTEKDDNQTDDTQKDEPTNPQDDTQEPKDETNKPTDKAKPFIAWLTKRINSKDARYHPNRGDYIFSESLTFGEDVIFVSPSLLDKYFSISGTAPDAIKDSLKNANPTDTASYQLIRGDECIPLLRIPGIPIVNAVGLADTIEEVPHE